MIAFLLVLIVACFGSLVVQHFIPPVAFLEGARVFLMPVVFFYGALALPYGLTLALAVVCGFMWDALTVQVVSLMGEGGITNVVEIAFGWSIVLYALLGAVMSGFRPLFLRGRWEIHCLMSGLLVSLMVLAEFLMLSLRRVALYEATGFVINREIWWRIGGAGLIALALAPLVYWFLSGLSSVVNYHPRAAAARNRTEEV
ncbi:MAG TPA: hypothetical protein VNQ90_18160 [Chthoniobacteraceae bacterium]|nr:hypothetical protein [Chthoniobacteraceae bacterium]